MIPIPVYNGWTQKKLDGLMLSCHHEFNHGLFRGIDIDLTREKPKYSDSIDNLFGEWCSLLVRVTNSEQNDVVLNYLKTCRKLLPDVFKFGQILTREWTKPYKMSANVISLCEKMTVLLDQICFLSETLDDYNQYRIKIGLEPVDEIVNMESWKSVMQK